MNGRRVIALGLAVLIWGWTLGLDHLIETTDLPSLTPQTSVEMRDRNNRLMRVYPVDGGIIRMDTRTSDIDRAYVDMLIRYEDKRFYTHHGVDPWALLRAAAQAVLNRRPVSGGSTLTMQTARLLEDGSTGRWSGKLRQMRVALALERKLTKDEILSLYLTHAPFGGHLEGVRAASFAWFGKEPTRLTPAEAALLVALPQSPERRRPDRAPDAAHVARDRVLVRMERQGLLSTERITAAFATAVPRKMLDFPRHAPHLADRLHARDPQTQRFHLTLDRGLQHALEVELAQAVRNKGDRLSAAVVVADHRTGEILASVGSPAYRAGQRLGFVDMTVAPRSPGSTLKPLVYGLAFDRGLAHPETVVRDAAINVDGYAPQNFDGQFYGDVSMRRSLKLSLNTPVIRLLDVLGPARLMSTLRKGGADPQVPGGRAGLAIGLGGLGVTLHDLVEVYAGLAAGGQGPQLRVTKTPTAQNNRMMSARAAWYLSDILRDVAPPPGAPQGSIAFKTGTSYGHRDAWAIGWDGEHVIGVWMGRADGTPVPGAFGGALAAPVLFQAFGLAKPAIATLPPPPQDALIVDTAALPLPLQRFENRYDIAATADSVQLVFPPDGAELVGSDVLTVKLRGGTAPFTVLQDGRPVLTGQRRREFDIPGLEQGYSQLVVIDQTGQSDRVTIGFY